MDVLCEQPDVDVRARLEGVGRGWGVVEFGPRLTLDLDVGPQAGAFRIS